MEVMASVFSILTACRSNYCAGNVSIGADEARAFMHMYAAGVTHAAKAREDAATNARFLDMHYLDLVRDPVDCVRRVYDHAGEAFTAAAKQRTADWVAANRQGKHGKHRYLLSDYGLTQADVHDAFADYIDHFGVELESGA